MHSFNAFIIIMTSAKTKDHLSLTRSAGKRIFRIYVNIDFLHPINATADKNRWETNYRPTTAHDAIRSKLNISASGRDIETF